MGVRNRVRVKVSEKSFFKKYKSENLLNRRVSDRFGGKVFLEKI